MNALIVIWPVPAARPSLVLAIEYNPPLRPIRKAPPSIRATSLDEGQTSQLADLFASLPAREDRS